MATITLKINEKSKEGKALMDLIKLFSVKKTAVEIVSEEENPYNPAFIKKIAKARAEKGGITIDPDNLWESIK